MSDNQWDFDSFSLTDATPLTTSVNEAPSEEEDVDMDFQLYVIFVCVMIFVIIYIINKYIL